MKFCHFSNAYNSSMFIVSRRFSFSFCRKLSVLWENIHTKRMHSLWLSMSGCPVPKFFALKNRFLNDLLTDWYCKSQVVAIQDQQLTTLFLTLSLKWNSVNILQITIFFFSNSISNCNWKSAYNCVISNEILELKFFNFWNINRV